MLSQVWVSVDKHMSSWAPAPSFSRITGLEPETIQYLEWCKSWFATVIKVSLTCEIPGGKVLVWTFLRGAFAHLNFSFAPLYFFFTGLSALEISIQGETTLSTCKQLPSSFISNVQNIMNRKQNGLPHYVELLLMFLGPSIQLSQLSPWFCW